MLALSPIFVIAGAINPKTIKGTIKDITWLRIYFIDCITFIIPSLEYMPIIIPNAIPIKSLIKK